jgi:DNA recombination protein RmuC
MSWPAALAFLCAGFLTGAAVAALWMRARLVESEAARKMAEAAAGGMGATFQSLADAALRSNQQAFLAAARATLETVRTEMTGDLAQRQTAVESLVKPIGQSLEKLDTQVRLFEAARERAFGSLDGRLGELTQAQSQLQKETAALVTALRAPHVRGRWGEITLRRVAELAGMCDQCDFFEQETHSADGARIRPDMLVRLPEGRTLVVDAKVPLTAYLDAAAAADEAARRDSLARHAQQVRRHLEQLSSKSYWSQFQPAPEFVVLFLPGDHFFSAALEHNPELIEDAAARKVLVATPTTLIAILKGAAYGWRQQRMAENAGRIQAAAAELYERVENVHAHFAQVGAALAKATESFNRCAGSLEARVYPSLRRLRDLGATTAPEPEPAARIEAAPRIPASFEAP